MPRSIALSTLLCYYPPELSVSALARVGELFGITAGTMWAALSGLVAAKNVAAEGGLPTHRATGPAAAGTGSQRAAAVETMACD